jgi:hypothetical protein
MTDIDTGLNVWQMTSNHNRMIELQADNSPPRESSRATARSELRARERSIRSLSSTSWNGRFTCSAIR